MRASRARRRAGTDAIAFPTVHRFHPDEAPLDVLRYVLGARNAETPTTAISLRIDAGQRTRGSTGSASRR